MVFEDRILDADGNELANSKWPRPSAVTLTSEMVLELLEGLPDSPKNAILSFWLMIRAHHLCDETAGYREIVATMNRVFHGEDESAVASEDLRQLYPDGIPELGAWRRAIARGAAELRLTPNGAKFLRDLNLPRHD
jgi:hypothetical protein